MLEYVGRHPELPAVPEAPEAPQMWKVYWSKPQVEARSHESMIKCQVAMSQLYSCDEEVDVDLTSMAMYADRFRVRQPGATADLPPHLDNGSIERWEAEANASTFAKIWEGKWEEYDAWDMSFRSQAPIDMYGGPGACSVFRSIQGWLSLAENGPNKGTLQVVPEIRLSTAYLMLRPFFDSNNKLDMTSRYWYGADPGKGQVVTEKWHPGLKMDQTMTSMPDCVPGDYVFWHCDMIHMVEPEHNGTSDSSVAYIPVVPLTQYNIGNLVEQRKAFLASVPPPDMVPSDGEGLERDHEDELRGKPEHVLTVEGRRILGLEKLDVEEKGISPGQRRARILANQELGL
jgi:hypothetical protein